MVHVVESPRLRPASLPRDPPSERYLPESDMEDMSLPDPTRGRGLESYTRELHTYIPDAVGMPSPRQNVSGAASPLRAPRCPFSPVTWDMCGLKSPQMRKAASASELELMCGNMQDNDSDHGDKGAAKLERSASQAMYGHDQHHVHDLHVLQRGDDDVLKPQQEDDSESSDENAHVNTSQDEKKKPQEEDVKAGTKSATQTRTEGDDQERVSVDANCADTKEKAEVERRENGVLASDTEDERVQVPAEMDGKDAKPQSELTAIENMNAQLLREHGTLSGLEEIEKNKGRDQGEVPCGCDVPEETKRVVKLGLKAKPMRARGSGGKRGAANVRGVKDDHDEDEDEIHEVEEREGGDKENSVPMSGDVHVGADIDVDEPDVIELRKTEGAKASEHDIEPSMVCPEHVQRDKSKSKYNALL
jgi:hypothetical protein